jgi:hypothetical protein
MAADGDHSGFHWLKLRKVEYKDRKGLTRIWEICDRTTKKGFGQPCVLKSDFEGNIDGVIVFATLRSKSRKLQPVKVAVISQVSEHGVVYV